MDSKAQTIETYTKSALALSEKYDKSGTRTEDIDHVFSNYHKDNPFVFEIGYGNGRDAEYISKFTDRYTGIDVSPTLSAIAKSRLPNINFTIADVEEYTFPQNIDIIFAFASLIHVPKESLKNIMNKLHTSLVDGGLIFISVKSSSSYEEITLNDQFGKRTFWHYSKADLEELATGFEIESMTESKIGDQDWLEVLYKKR